MLLTGLPITASEALQSGLVGSKHKKFIRKISNNLLLTFDRQRSATIL